MQEIPCDAHLHLIKCSGGQIIEEAWFIEVHFDQTISFKYRIYPCTSQPFTAQKLFQKIAINLYVGQKLRSKKGYDKFFV